MKEKMPWLKNRLREIGKTPTALAKALGIAPPRVYEMIAGRRHIQPKEIPKMAAFLEWSLEELQRHLPESARGVLTDLTVTHGVGLGMVPISGAEVRRMIDSAPKPVDADEVRDAVLSLIAQRFAGRPVVWDTIERGLALAAFACRLQTLKHNPLPNA